MNEVPVALGRPLQGCLEALVASGARRVAVALSGGPDSLALAGALASLAPRQYVSLEFWHVHHGLMLQADAWQASVERFGEVLQVRVRTVRVELDGVLRQRQGVEAAARAARYQAFAGLALESGCRHLMLAQHQDDQAETVLLRLLRGAGPAGLAAMRMRRTQGELTFWRPWLAVSRAAILPYADAVAQEASLALADDLSNLDPQYARGWLRQHVLPALAGFWPGYRLTLARHAQQAAELHDWLEAMVAAELDALAVPEEPAALNIAAWRALAPQRARLVLRGWLARQGLGPPTEARLADLERQLREAGTDSAMRWRHDGALFGQYRNRLLRIPPPALPALPDVLRRWQHEAVWHVQEPLGQLHFETVARGLSGAWLAEASLRLSWCEEGGRLRLQPDAPSRSLKAWFQRCDMPPWERQRQPRLWRGAQLVYVGGLGQSADLPQSEPGIRLRWEPSALPDDK